MLRPSAVLVPHETDVQLVRHDESVDHISPNDASIWGDGSLAVHPGELKA